MKVLVRVAVQMATSYCVRWASRCAVLLTLVIACGYPRPADVEPDGSTGDPKYQLLALQPDIARTGDTITLEGTFDSTVTVNFPGGVSQAATVLSDHRATVIVPAGATIGALSITTAGMTVGLLTFRRASFELGLQPSRSRSDQAGSARQESALVNGRTGSVSAVIGNFMYVIGGSDGTGYLRSVERARINADGTLTPFTTSSGSLVNGRASHTCVVLGIFLYVIGGINDTGILGSVERASIAPDGSLGSFTVVPGIVLAAARKEATATLLGNSLYIIGGTGSGVLGSVERATINGNGSLGAFELVSGLTLDTPRTSHSGIVIGNRLYIIGGSSTSGVTGTVEQAIIAADGSLNGFLAVQGVGLVTPRASHTNLVLGKSLYVLGGAGGGGALTSIEQALVRPDGTLGTFSTSSTSLAMARGGHVNVILGNRLSIIGGRGLGDVYLRTVEHAGIDASSELGFFAVASNTTLVKADFVPTSLALGSYLYALEIGAVSRAKVREGGSLETFDQVSDPGLAPNRSGYSVALLKDKVYLLGGSHSTASGLVVDTLVEDATISTESAFGPFLPTSGVALNKARTGSMSVILRDYLYAIGGTRQDSSYENSIERATIHADGSLSQFALVGATAVAGRVSAIGVVLGEFCISLAAMESTHRELWSGRRSTLTERWGHSPWFPV